MAMQQRLETAKQDWLDSAEVARQSLQQAQEQYNTDQEMGLVDNDASVVDWISRNCPQYMAAYHDFSSKAAQFQQLLAMVDQGAFSDLQRKLSDGQRELMDEGIDQGFWILTPDV